jgi:hypothetical protein
VEVLAVEVEDSAPAPPQAVASALSAAAQTLSLDNCSGFVHSTAAPSSSSKPLTTPRPLLTLLFSEAKSESFKIPVNTTFSYRPSRTSKPAPEPLGPHRHGPAGGGGRRACLLAVACLSLGLAHAQTASNPDTLDERLNLLERQLRDLAAENQALRHELGVTNVYVKPTGPVQELKIGGIIQAQADFGDKGDARWTSDNDRFYVRRARIKALGRFLEDFDFKIELDLAGALGESSSLRAQLTDGWVNWNHYDFARIKAGQFFPCSATKNARTPPPSKASSSASPATGCCRSVNWARNGGVTPSKTDRLGASASSMA